MVSRSWHTQREIKKVLVVAITSYWWCFNSNVIKESKACLEFYTGKQVDIFAIVKKGNTVVKTNSVGHDRYMII
jgi:F-type H+-transporting ATPase subunit gamma